MTYAAVSSAMRHAKLATHLQHTQCTAFNASALSNQGIHRRLGNCVGPGHTPRNDGP